MPQEVVSNHSLTGINSHQGPFLDGNDNLYVVVESSDEMRIYKSTDGGTNWSEQDSTNRPGLNAGHSDIRTHKSIIVGDQIHTAYQSEDASQPGDWEVRYVTFNVSTHGTPDAWGTPEDVDSGTVSNHYPVVTIAVFGNGDKLITYTPDENSGTQDTDYAYNTGSGWNAGNAFFNSSTEDVRATSSVLGESDKLYVFYGHFDYTPFRYYYKTFTSATATPSAETRVDDNGTDSSFGYALQSAYHDHSGTERITTGFVTNSGNYAASVEIDNDGTPSAEETVDTTYDMEDAYGAGYTLMADDESDIVYALWSYNNVYDIYLKEDDGTGWANRQKLQDGATYTAQRISAGFYKKSSGDKYVGWLYSDTSSGGVWFDEVLVEEGGTAHTTTISESVGATDVISTVVGQLIAQTIADSLGITDSLSTDVTSNVIQKSLYETVGLVDSHSIIATYKKLFSDSVNASDVFPEKWSEVGSGEYILGKNSRQGPWRDSNGNLYVLTDDAVGGTKLRMWKSTDEGNTWNRKDEVNEPGINTGQDDIDTISGIFIGDQIHIMYEPTGTNPPGDVWEVRYVTFNVSTHISPDQWNAPEDVDNGTDSGYAPAGDIAVLSNGDKIIFYTPDRNNTTYEVHYAYNTGSGWVSGNVFESSSTLDHKVNSVVLGASDKIYIPYIEIDSGVSELFYRTMTSVTGTPSARERLDNNYVNSSHSVSTTSIYHDHSGVERITTAYQDGSKDTPHGVEINDGVESAPEEISSSYEIQDNYTQGQTLIANQSADAVYSVWINDPSGDIYIADDLGGGWTNVRVAVSGADAKRMCANFYTDGSGNKIAGILFWHSTDDVLYFYRYVIGTSAGESKSSSVSDSLGISDVLGISIYKRISILDAIGITDIFANLSNSFKALLQGNVGIIDSHTSFLALIKVTIQEAVGITDSIERVADFIRNIYEDVNVYEKLLTPFSFIAGEIFRAFSLISDFSENSRVLLTRIFESSISVSFEERGSIKNNKIGDSNIKKTIELKSKIDLE